MRCPESTHLQDYLEGMLPPDAAGRMSVHLSGCPRCNRELAAWRRLFATLGAAPLFEPGPALTERILARVLPSRLRRSRRIAALGWSYAAAVALSVAGFALWALQPAPRTVLTHLAGEASRRLVGTVVFVLDAAGFSVFRLADGWGWLHLTGVRFAPVGRALVAVAAQPAIELTLWAAAAVCGALLWWMKPQLTVRAKEAGHVRS